MYIGVDLGGTNIAVGLVDEQGRILAQDSTPTISTRPYTEIVKDMARLAEKVTADAGYTMKDVKAIGIGSPGAIDNKNGVVTYANNIPMENAAMAEEMRKYFDLPVNLENDANAAAFGEYIINGNDADSFIFVTLGTGVGGGIVIDKKIYRGFNGVGAEVGHMTLVHDGVDCTCGKKGCWEAYASVTGLIRQTEEAIKAHPESRLAEIAKENEKVSGRTAFLAAKEGDPVGQEVVEAYLRYVADGIVGLINIFQPEKLVIGGGISKEGDYLLGPIKTYVEEKGYNHYMPRTQIEIAKLFNDAGIIGAAMAAKV